MATAATGTTTTTTTTATALSTSQRYAVTTVDVLDNDENYLAFLIVEYQI